MSQSELAEIIGRDQGTIAKYEKGEVDFPVTVLIAIAKALNCTEYDLLHRRPGTSDAITETFATLKLDKQEQVLAYTRFIAAA